MSYTHRPTNPIKRLGYPDWAEYQVFKDYLRIPIPYLVKLFKRQVSLHTVAYSPHLLGQIEIAQWKALLKVNSDDLQHQAWLAKLRASGIPPIYAEETEFPQCSTTVLDAWTSMCQRPAKLASTGHLIYMHSLQETNALKAASAIGVAAVKEALKVRMMIFGEFMDAIKTFEESKKIQGMAMADIAMLYMIGTEYSTEFTASHLESFIRKRKASGKTTILVSHLSPAQFKSRYDRALDGDSGFGAVTLKFDDPKITVTVNQLIKELAEHE